MRRLTDAFPSDCTAKGRVSHQLEQSTDVGMLRVGVQGASGPGLKGGKKYPEQREAARQRRRDKLTTTDTGIVAERVWCIGMNPRRDSGEQHGEMQNLQAEFVPLDLISDIELPETSSRPGGLALVSGASHKWRKDRWL